MARRGHSLIDTYKDEAPPSFQNNFTAGLKTEFTGLNFPPNAATDTDNCIFTMQGDVVRRPGFDFEKNFNLKNVSDTGAISSYHWKNAGGDGETQIYVLQVGGTLRFYKSSDATVAAPLSNHILSSVVNIDQFLASGSSLDPSIIECQYSDGNGYLFVYNSACDPFFCSIANDVITPSRINVQIRDFVGYPEPSVSVTTRPQTLTNEHNYNLQNQGWTVNPSWTTTSTSNVFTIVNTPVTGGDDGHIFSLDLGNHSFQVDSGLVGVIIGEGVTIKFVATTFGYNLGANTNVTNTHNASVSGTVISYSGTTMVIDVNTLYSLQDFHEDVNGFQSIAITITPAAFENTISIWNQELGNFPSNADVWWLYKTAVETATTVSGVTTTIQADTFDPGTTNSTVSSPNSPAAKGHFVLNAFDQQQSIISGIAGLTPINTSARPRTGAWFQGRVFYAGADASQPAQGDQNFYTWTENIYFSQIITDQSQFGFCYQTDDPTDENLFLLLPSDGGVITIQGSGSIFKLFPIQNGMLVFAANGVWFITGSTGIGFTASDYTITKISAVRSISSTSFVDVNGLPLFWNEEGIYAVEPAQQGLGLTVNPLTVGTIKSFYDQIPYESKRFARGSYDPINYVVQWIYNEGAGTGNAILIENPNTVFEEYIFDDSCFLETSVDKGTTWTESHTPDDTLSDAWDDLQMAIVDGDYDTMVAFNSRHLGNENSSILAISTEKGINGSWTYINPSSPGADGTSDHPQLFSSGAISAGGQIIIALPNHKNIGSTWPDLTLSYPRISRDKGITWTDITTLGSGRVWEKACFSKDATVMYMSSYLEPNSDFLAIISKSIDGGITWVDLETPNLSSSNYPVHSQKIRCNEDGSVVLYVDNAGDIFLSKNGGTTWIEVMNASGDSPVFTPISILPDSFYIFGSDVCDCGVSLDGQTLIASFANVGSGVLENGDNSYLYSSALFISTDGGTTWQQKFPIGITENSGNNSLANCNVSPGGQAFLLTYETSDPSVNYLSDISSDKGLTWVESVVTPLIVHEDAIVAAYIVPISNFIPASTIPNPNGAETDNGFNSALNLNIFTKAFYPWTISEGEINGVTTPFVHDIKYIQNPGGEGAPEGIFKYVSSVGNPISGTDFTFSEASDPTFVDWDYATETDGLDYSSYFITGFSLDGQGLRKFQPGYINVFSRNTIPNAYSIQGLWDYATSGAAGRWTSRQVAYNKSPLFGMVHKRHKIRGQGYALQFKFSSVDNNPFDIIGWSIWSTMNMGV